MKETIEIFQSKQTVVCLKKQDGKVIARGVARYNPNDEKEGLPFDYDFGADLALKRMIESCRVNDKVNIDSTKCDFVIKLPKIKTLKDGTKIIKQDSYEVGDKVLLKKNIIDMFLEQGVSVEKIVKIDRFYGQYCCKNGIICNSGCPRGVSNSDIEGKVIE